MTEPTIRWSRVARGVFLTGLGIFLLFNTQGILPWGIWGDALRFWPAILVAVGLRLVFDRSRMPWVTLLSPLLLLGVLGWVAATHQERVDGEWSPVTLDRPAGLSGLELDATGGFVELAVDARPLAASRLLAGRTLPTEDVDLDVSEDRARIHVGDDDVVFLSKRRRWELSVPDDLPLDLDGGFGFASGEIDLSRSELRRGRLEGAFNDLTLRLGAPAEEVQLDFEGAFQNLRLVVPADVPVTVRSDGALNRTHGRRHRPDSESAPGYVVHLDGFANRLRVEAGAPAPVEPAPASDAVPPLPPAPDA